MLTTLGYTPLIAVDGVDGILQMQTHDAVIDGILMDQSMPRKDGITATRDIRDMEAAGLLRRRHRLRPIIAVTPVVNPGAVKIFQEAGEDGFLAKPLSLQRLEIMLEKFFGHGQNTAIG